MAASAQLRYIKELIREIEIIEVECGGEGSKKVDSTLDHFQRTKLELNEIMKTLKQDIKTQKGIEERVGTNSESIKLKHQITKNLSDAKRLASELEDAYEHQITKNLFDQKDYDNGQSDGKVIFVMH